MTAYNSNSFFLNEQFPFYIERRKILKGEKVVFYCHEVVELVYVVRGNACHEVSGKTYTLGAGDVSILESKLNPGYSGSVREDTIIYNVIFNRELLKRELDALRHTPSQDELFFLTLFMKKSMPSISSGTLKPHQRLQVETILKTLCEEFHRRPDGFQIVIKNRLIECLILLSRFHRENRAVFQNGHRDRDRVHSIAQFVEQHYNQSFTLTDLCKTYGMSVSSFSEKFKSVTGQSLMEYKQDIQIKQACSLLSYPGKKVLEVAFQVGFNDISFFNKTFKKYIGMTPSQFRLRHQENIGI